MYNPALGTFINRDPLAADANLYRYCGDSPTNRTDPSGLAIMYLPPQEPLPVDPILQLSLLNQQQEMELEQFYAAYLQRLVANPTAETERMQIIQDVLYFKTTRLKKTSLRPYNMCEEQASAVLAYLIMRHYKYWTFPDNTYNGRNPYLGQVGLWLETQNVVLVVPNPKTNPNGLAWVIDPYWGYTNQKPGIRVYQNLAEFEFWWPVQGDYPRPAPRDTCPLMYEDIWY
jgi:hypothetical protein